MLADMNQDSSKDKYIDRLGEPEKIASAIGHRAKNEDINATTLEVAGGLCYSGEIAKQGKFFQETE